ASVARNWVERGHYGRLALGENSAPGLEAALPLTGAVALSFKIFGIGLAQARAVVAIYLIAALILLFYLARRFYDRKVALGACWALLLVSGIRYIHPLFMGRQILAEVPALFFLLAGYVCFLRSLERRPSALLGAIIFWSLALITKAQVLPFWAASLALPLVFAALATGGVFCRRVPGLGTAGLRMAGAHLPLSASRFFFGVGASAHHRSGARSYPARHCRSDGYPDRPADAFGSGVGFSKREIPQRLRDARRGGAVLLSDSRRQLVFLVGGGVHRMGALSLPGVFPRQYFCR